MPEIFNWLWPKNVPGLGIGWSPTGKELINVGMALTPEHFKAEAGVQSDQSAALKRAFESGYIIDGGGRTYYVAAAANDASSIVPTSLRGILRMKLVRMQSSTNMGGAVLDLDTLSGFEIDGLEIDGGGYFTNTSQVQGLYVRDSHNFAVKNVVVKNFGQGSPIRFDDSYDFTTDAITSKQHYYNLAGITNDVIDGISYVRCHDVRAAGLVVHTILGTGAAESPTRYSRGVLVATSHDMALTNVLVHNVDQAVDFSSAIPGNYGISLTNFTIHNVATFGVKMANCSRHNVVANGVVREAGVTGYIASDQTATHTFTSLTSSGTTATAVMGLTAHGEVAAQYLPVGAWIKVSGAVETAYNGLFQVASVSSVGDNTTITYTMAGAASASPATGTPVAANMAYITMRNKFTGCKAIDCGGSDANSLHHGFVLQSYGNEVIDCTAQETRTGGDREMQYGVYSERIKATSSAEALVIPFNIIRNLEIINLIDGYADGDHFTGHTNATISGGVLDLTNYPVGEVIRITGEGSAADNLDTIIAPVGDGVTLRIRRGADNITVKHNTGNIVNSTGADVVLAASSYVYRVTKSVTGYFGAY